MLSRRLMALSGLAKTPGPKSTRCGSSWRFPQVSQTDTQLGLTIARFHTIWSVFRIDHLIGGRATACYHHGNLHGTLESMLALDDAFDDELVHVVFRNDREGAFLVGIGELPTVVTIRLKKRSTVRGKVEYTTSHVIHTPAQAQPYRTRLPFGDDHSSAVVKALQDLTLYYRLATRDGHRPQMDWLVPF